MNLPEALSRIQPLVALGSAALLLFSGCSRSPASRIERVLNQCAAISAKASSMPVDGAAKAGYVAREFQAIDVSGCPPDFRAAFQMHVNAWSQAQMAYASNSIGANFLEGFVAGVTENPSGLGATQRGASAAQQYVNATYYQLTEIAAAYGARVPRSAVN